MAALTKNEKILFQDALAGRAEEVKKALAEGVNANAMDEHGTTPLKLAIVNGHTDVVNALLTHRGNKADINVVDRNGISPLKLALEKMNFTMAKRMLQENGGVGRQKLSDEHLASALTYIDGLMTRVDNAEVGTKDKKEQNMAALLEIENAARANLYAPVHRKAERVTAGHGHG